MSELHYPNESAEYRKARNQLLEEEIDLIAKVKAVAAQRRKLPLGGKLKDNYTFIGANAHDLGKEARFADLFGDKNTLMIYSYMYGPNWDKPCLSCTSIVDGFDRVSHSITEHAAFAVVAKATAKQLNDWAESRGWSQIRLYSAEKSEYLRDYNGQNDETDASLVPMMNVFRKTDDGMFHFWGTEMQGNSIDMVWAYWNLMDMTPEGRPDTLTPPQDFRSKFLEKHYLGQ